MSNKEKDDTIPIVSGVNESNITASENLAKNEESEVQNIGSQLPKCTNLLSDGLQQLKEQSRQESSGIKAKYKENHEIRFKMSDELAKRFADRYLANYTNLTLDQIVEIGEILMRNYADIKESAMELGLPHYILRTIIERNSDVMYFYNIALQGIKELNDSNVVKFLRAGDKDMTKVMTRLLYKGRKMGAFNPSEFGTMGFGDEVGEYNASVTKEDEADRDNFTINFNFETKPIPPQPLSVDGELLDDDAIAEAITVEEIMAHETYKLDEEEED